MSANSKIKIHPVLISDGPGYKGVTSYAAILPLGVVVSYAKVYKQGLLKDSFDFQPLVIRTQAEFHAYADKQIVDSDTAGIWLFSSYVWNRGNNLELAQAIKNKSPKSIVIMGGPHVPAYENEAREFFEKYSAVDIAVREEGEIALAEILEVIGKNTGLPMNTELMNVKGLTFRHGQQILRTPDRTRNRHLDIFPSPYLTGEFDDPCFNNLQGMVIETNRGCPFGCTFCDWGSATLQKFSLFDLERVKQEIEILARKGTHHVHITDSNFGAFERDVEIAECVAAAKRKYGYPQKFGVSFAKNASLRLAEITKILRTEKLISYGLISIQSTDPAVLSAINRANIRLEKHEKLIDIFRNEGLTLSSELLIGLPGQTVESHKADLQFFFDRKLMTMGFCTSLMPNAPMNEPEYKKKYKIVTDQDNFVISTSTFSEAEYRRMVLIFLAFQFFYVLGVLKYFLYFLQCDYSIKATDFIDDLLDATKDKNLYPLGYKLQTDLLNKVDDKLVGTPTLRWKTEDSQFLFENIDAYYDEISRFTVAKYNLNISKSELNTLMTLQKSLMPAMGKSVPFTVPLEHDFVAYFDQIKKTVSATDRPDTFRPLVDFPPGSLTVKATAKKTINNLNLLRIDQHRRGGWELKSVLRF